MCWTWHKGQLSRPLHARLGCYTLLKLSVVDVCALVALLVKYIDQGYGFLRIRDVKILYNKQEISNLVSVGLSSQQPAHQQPCV